MLPGKHKLMREGAVGQAVVLREQRRGAGTRDWRQYLDVRFQYPDGSFVEFSGYVLHSDIEGNFFTAGDLVPVRYDAMDHKRIVFDVARLRTERGSRDDGREQLRPAGIGGSGLQVAPGAAPGLTPEQVAIALEQMAELGDLRHRGALTDSDYQAEKTRFQELTTRRATGAITEPEFQTQDARRRAALPSADR
jgi:Protein of unknown function (DUF3592)/Short C-terminal domain